MSVHPQTQAYMAVRSAISRMPSVMITKEATAAAIMDAAENEIDGFTSTVITAVIEDIEQTLPLDGTNPQRDLEIYAERWEMLKKITS